MAAVRTRVLVSGRVQGVFFRSSCAGQAAAAGVSGWVRNRPDGTVEAVFEGAPDAVRRLVDWCRTGPPAAVVSGVRTSAEPPEGASGFTER